MYAQSTRSASSRRSWLPHLVVAFAAIAASTANAQRQGVGGQDVPGGTVKLNPGVPVGEPGAPPVGPVSPTTGDEGTAIQVTGDFSVEAAAYGAKDVLMEGAGTRGFLGRGTSLQPNAFGGDVVHVSPFPTSQKVLLHFGAGAEALIPSLDGVVLYPQPAWTWVETGASTSLSTTNSFQPTPSFIDLPCEEMPMEVDVRFRLDPADGCLKARLPGAGTCSGDVLSYFVLFSTNSGKVALTLPATSPTPNFAWGVASGYLTFPMNIQLASAGVVAGYDFLTQELTLCPLPGTVITGMAPSSYVRIRFDPTKHQEFEEIAGVDDDFLGGIDLSSPSAAFSSFVAALIPSQGQREYDDEGSCDRNLRETFDDFGSTSADGPVRMALYEVHINAYSCLTTTDSIVIGWDGAGAMDWSEKMIQLDDLAMSWVPGQEATLCFNLNELPETGQTTTRSILHRVESDVLDTYIQDDTEVDYIKLRVLRCKP